MVSERTKWLLAIGVLAISTGLTAHNVISYPEECKPDITAINLIEHTNGIS
ncbi:MULTISPECIES: hypothetical protein [Prochlorococcus]|uniref:hypothetical protein n=1 Tax=Prochlorococcus TaxID=1218 RepID=UPI00187C8727|nr:MULTISPECIES: hypothetical protein [Prochlorococcus]